MSNVGGMSTDLTVAEEAGARFVEGTPGRQLMRSTEDARLVIEACISNNVDSALLYAANLPEKFFDLGSGEAGAILQKLRNYRIRVAVVCAPGDVCFSSRFNEMAEEESRGDCFRLFDSRRTAQEWLQSRSQRRA